MAYDPDLQPVLDEITRRLTALETAGVKAHAHPEYAAATHSHAGTPPVPGAIQITPTTTNLIGSAAAGATFQFAAGTYKRLQVAPKTGQTFLGGPGVIMDGEGVTVAAFRSTTAPAPNDVTIRGFEVKNYKPVETPGWSEGAITSIWYGDQGGGDNWLVENCDVHHNRGAGVMLSNKGRVIGGRVHHNYSIGVKLYWAPNGGLLDGVEIDYNNFDAPPDFNETGGTKFAWTVGMVARRCKVHHNRGPGLWTDIENRGTVYEDNICEDNDGPGITHEVSHDVIVRRNQVRRNGFGAQGAPGDTWGWGAGILIANSFGALIGGSAADANIVEGNASQIMFIHQNRIPPIGAQGTGANQYQTGGTVRSNRVKGPGRNGAVQDVGNGNYFTGKVKFEDNDYTSPLPTFVMGGGNLTWAQWQTLGHDLTGSVS